MVNILSKLFQWHPSRETLIPSITGLVVIALSLAMIPARMVPWIQIILRDIMMIYVVGILFPLLYIQGSTHTFRAFGLSLKRWYIFLPISLVLAVLMLIMFLSENPPPPDFNYNRDLLLKLAFLLLAGIFEVVFFYSFLRTLFERAFGIVPGIVLAALFYAFHHVGFQPEFGKLIFVGLLYATVFRLGNSALLIYPFFWGIGASYDVLIQSQVISPILYPGIRSLYLSVLILIVVIWAWRKVKIEQSQATTRGGGLRRVPKRGQFNSRCSKA